MDGEINNIFDESIQLEINVAELYTLFSTIFIDDTSFWKRLAMEEENHANLIRDGKKRFQPLGKFPVSIMSSSLEELKIANNKIIIIIEECNRKFPSREEAFNIALDLEQRAGELHYQQFMEKEAESELDRIFQRLNRDDKDHVKKLKEYMKSNNIRIRQGN